MEFKGIKPYEFQEEIINDVINGDAFYYTLVTGRQIGKTLLLINLLLYFGINNPKTIILWVSPVYSQAVKVLSQILDAMDGASIIKEANKSEKIISFINGSRIYFRSAERPETIRGLAVNYCFIDEAQDISDEAFNKSILPTLTAAGKKLMVAGTPKRKNWFYNYFKRGQETYHKKYLSYTAPSSISPYVSAEFIEEQRQVLPYDIFRQEFLAEWVAGQGVVFKNIDECCVLNEWPKTNEKNFGGLDIGTHTDYTVLTILDRVGRVIYIDRYKDIEYSQIIRKTKEIGLKYNANILVETNGVGDPVFEMLKKEYHKITPFTTTNKSKQNLITQLISDMEDMSVQLPSKELFPALYNELHEFEYEYSPSGLLTYSAPAGLHDDTVMSLALANWHRISAPSSKIIVKKI
jgi:phage terminase large subunit